MFVVESIFSLTKVHLIEAFKIRLSYEIFLRLFDLKPEVKDSILEKNEFDYRPPWRVINQTDRRPQWVGFYFRFRSPRRLKVVVETLDNNKRSIAAWIQSSSNLLKVRRLCLHFYDEFRREKK